MPKKSDSHHENRGKSSMEHGSQKEGREQRGGGHQNDSRQQGRRDESAKPEGFQQQNREESPGNNVGGLGGYRKALRENRKRFQGKGPGEGNKKNGCLPKLFMLVLPFMAIGTYLLLSS
jgi:hypothetical protein